MRAHTSIVLGLLLLPAAAVASLVASEHAAAPPLTLARATLQPLAAPVIGANVRVTTASGPANEVMLAVDPTDPRHLIATAKDYTLTASTPQRCSVNRVWGGLYVSFDGGASWTNGHFPGALATDPQTAASGFDCMSDPVVVFGPDGVAHFTGLLEAKHVPGLGACAVTGLGECAVEYGLLYARSRDGLSWSDDQLVWTGTSGLAGAGDAWADKNWQAVDPSDPTQVYVTWDLIAGALPKPMLSHSIDGGRTWITTPLPIQGDAGLAAPVVDADGTLYVALVGACTQQPRTPIATSCVNVLRSSDHGASFLVSDAGTISGGSPNTPYRTVTSPYVAARGGHVFVAWSDAAYGARTLAYLGRVEIARSTDGGATFTRARLADDATQHQVMPQVAVNAAGLVGVLYYEDDATSAHHMRARVQTALDGVAWSGPANVSDVSFTPQSSHHQDGFVFMGDYLGLAAGSDGAFHAAWTDTRNGRADVYSASIGP